MTKNHPITVLVLLSKSPGVCFFYQTNNTIHFGGLFALKQWISSSMKRDTVPRVNNVYCFNVKILPTVLHYGMVKIVIITKSAACTCCTCS